MSFKCFPESSISMCLAQSKCCAHSSCHVCSLWENYTPAVTGFILLPKGVMICQPPSPQSHKTNEEHFHTNEQEKQSKRQKLGKEKTTTTNKAESTVSGE